MPSSPTCIARRGLVGVIAVGATLAACRAPDPLPTLEDERHPASPILIEAASDSDPARRARAILAMGRIQSPDYVAALAEATRDDERAVRLAALFALGQLGLVQGAPVSEDAVSVCRVALREPDVGIVMRAVEALGKLAAPSAIDEVTLRLRHPDAEVRAAAALALFRYRFAPLWRGEADEPPPLPDESVGALLRALGDEDPNVQLSAETSGAGEQ